MSLPEKAAYLRGLYDGMELNAETSKEARMFNAIIDVIQEMAGHINENEDSLAAIADQVDDLSDALDLLAEELEDDEDEDWTPPSLDDLYDAEDEDDDFETQIDVECPKCHELLTIGEEELTTGKIHCDSCGQSFQIDVEFSDDQETEEEIPF